MSQCCMIRVRTNLILPASLFTKFQCVDKNGRVLTVEELGCIKASSVLESLNVRQDVIDAFVNAYFRAGSGDLENGGGGGGGGGSINNSSMEMLTPRRVGDRAGR